MPKKKTSSTLFAHQTKKSDFSSLEYFFGIYLLIKRFNVDFNGNYCWGFLKGMCCLVGELLHKKISKKLQKLFFRKTNFKIENCQKLKI